MRAREGREGGVFYIIAVTLDKTRYPARVGNAVRSRTGAARDADRSKLRSFTTSVPREKTLRCQRFRLFPVD